MKLPKTHATRGPLKSERLYKTAVSGRFPKRLPTKVKCTSNYLINKKYDLIQGEMFLLAYPQYHFLYSFQLLELHELYS